MEAVVLVDASPGFEESVAASLRKREEVKAVVTENRGNFDLAMLVEADDEGSLEQFCYSAVHRISGTKSRRRLESPPEELLERLRADATP